MGILHGSNLSPFQVFMTHIWHADGDLYFEDFEHALDTFLALATDEQKRDFGIELEDVARRGLIGGSTPEAEKYWAGLGRRTLSKHDYMLALRRLSRNS